MSEQICHIVCAGPCEKLDIKLGETDLLIAADGGYAHCLDAGLAPGLFIGDLDSLPAGMAGQIACERVELPRDKDDTDTMAACKEGLARGYRRFEIHAALGGDVGHELANIQLLGFLQDQGARGVLRGSGQEIHLVAPETSPASFNAPASTRVSVFAFGAPADKVTLCGLRWELDGALLRPDCPIGVSNRVQAGEFTVCVGDGRLLVVIG